MNTATSSRLVASPPAASGTRAAVLEYLCLFTHDLRRKQKRWQDGRLKYHTFNKRVMVYDDRGNFIGDMHWHADWDFDAGEEVQLERGGVMIQVCECVGQQSQDLSELVDKRLQEREQRLTEKEQRHNSVTYPRLSVSTPARTAAPRHGQLAANAQQIRHRPLTALIGTPTGHHGRALVPSESPFEQRRKTDEPATKEDASRPPKRRRYDETPPSKLGYAQSLFGTALTLSGAPPPSARLPSQPVPNQPSQKIPLPQATPPPTPEAESPALAPAPPSYNCNSADSRAPSRHVHDRRTNSAVGVMAPRPPKEARVKVLLPPRAGRADTMPFNLPSEQVPKTASGPKDIMDLTTSDDDGGSRRRAVTETSAVEADAPSRVENPLRAFRDGTVTQKRPVSSPAVSRIPAVGQVPIQREPSEDSMDFPTPDNEGGSRRRAVTETSFATAAAKSRLKSSLRTSRDKTVTQSHPVPRPAIGSIIQVEHVHSQQELNVPDKEPRRTELRLKSRKKRGLLVVSEQANAKPLATHFGEPDSAEAIRSAPEHTFHPKTARRKAGATPLSPMGTSLEYLTESTVKYGSSLAKKSFHTNGDMAQLYEGEDMGDKTRKRQSQEEQDDIRNDADPPVAKSRKKPRHSKVDSGADAIEEPTGETQCEPEMKKRAKRKPKQRKMSALPEDGNANNEQEDVPEAMSHPAAPRFVKLSRRSVRSKELIGFVFEDTDTQTANGTFLTSPPLNTRNDDLEPCSAAHPPGSTAVEACLTAGGDTESDTIVDDGDGVDDPRRNEGLNEPLASDAQKHESSRSPSAVGQIPADDGKGLGPCAPDVPIDRLNPPLRTMPPAWPSATETGQSCTDNPPTIPTERAKHEKQVPLDPSLWGSSKPEAAAKTRDRENESQDGVARDEAPKLVNPATRGRKAALKSHAAGQVPQQVLPSETGIQTAQVPHREQPKDTSAGATTSDTSKAPKVKMTFSGFVSAKGGGPWSREAHDLLETGRPS